MANCEPASLPSSGNYRSANLWLEALRNLRHSPSAMLGSAVIGALVIIAVLAPVFATHDPLQTMIGVPGETGRLPSKPPCIPILGCEEPQHILGLDLNARDLYSRVIYGTRTSLSVGVITISLSIIVGTTLGIAAGYMGGRVDNLIMRLMDVVLAFPALLLAISIVTILGPGLTNALLGITITFIPQYARLSRASVLSIKEQEFVVAEQALGASPLRIVLAHILPNAITPIIVQGTLGVGTAILDAAALSFLGLGAQPPTPEWGQILSESRNYLFTSPHLVFFPGFAIMITVLGFNLLGDGMRDALDPRLNRN
ncbi:MAG: ABC transporter permease [Chloroflexota bacterium]|nr:ABC transporter permease [Chloroflexota bacterium]MDE2907790.1 ABC transporter permease [Chloroflexota bacterium]